MAGGCAGVSSSRLGVAFACVIGAAFASVAGALFIVVLPTKNSLFLAASLAFASGVMLYISFVDIYSTNSVGRFQAAGFDSAHAFTYATICLFGGFPISYVLDKLAERVVYPGHEHGHQPTSPQLSGEPSGKALTDIKGASDQTSSSLSTSTVACDGVRGACACDVDAEMGLKRATDGSDSSDLSSPPTAQDPLAADNSQDAEQQAKARKLVHVGLLAALAMALHNMPEGLVTFIGYMDSFSSGITTAIAIAIHNIPEGMVIASAVYFGTGLRLKAVMWATLASLAEPCGGLVGLAVVCGGSLTNTVFGILFGLVAGIMIYISVKELLPSARGFDPEDRVTTAFLTIGMIVMACSLIAIEFSQPQQVVTRQVAAAANSTVSAAASLLGGAASVPPASTGG